MELMLAIFAVLVLGVVSFAGCQIAFDAAVERRDDRAVKWASRLAAGSLGIAFLAGVAVAVVGAIKIQG